MEQRNRKVQYLATLSVSLAFVALGAFSAWTSPVILKFNANETSVDISQSGVSWMVSLIPIGFIIGSFMTRFTSDLLGRRVTILLSSVPSIVASVIVTLATQGWLVGLTVFLWSCGTGMLSTVIGMYLAEITDKDLRGRLSLYTRFSFNFGNLLVMASGPALSYEMLNYILLPLPFLHLVACWWIPETPYYLLKEGKVETAKKTLQKLRGYKDEKTLEDELTAIQAGVKSEMSHSSSVKELFTGKQYRRAIVIAAGLKFTQIMTGGTTIKQYLGDIMTESQVERKHEQLVYLSFGVIGFGVSTVSSVFVDRVQRRTLLMSSYIGTGFSLIIVGIYFFLLEVVNINHQDLTVYGSIPFAGIILANVISTFGFVALSMIIPAEIFPLNVKAVAMTSLNIYGGLLGFIVGKGYIHVKNMGQFLVFWIFALVAVFGAVFTYFVIPETGRKELNDIQKEMQGDAYDAAASKLNEVTVKHLADNEEATELLEINLTETK